MMMDVANKNILIVGLGISGVSAARFLKRRGADVTVTDMAREEDLGAHVQEMRNMGANVELGQHRIGTFEKADLIVLSPGVPHTIPQVKSAEERGIPIMGELELASRFIEEPVVAITGTNGKTTTTELLGKMLVHSGVKVFVGGNIGNPLTGYVDKEEKAEVVVAEVSSFQLDTIDAFRPKVSVLLNITEDHLDRYPDFEAYVASKGRIFKNQKEGDIAVLNGSDPDVRSFCGKIKARQLVFCHEKKAGSTFREGAIIKKGDIVFKTAKSGTEDGDILKPSTSLNLSHVALMGMHNMENVSAASLAALAVGGTPGKIQSVLNDFKALSHRLEWIATINDVGYFNDSKATNVDSVARALECFTAPIILIMGGRNKGSNFSVLKNSVRQHVKKLIVMGEAKDDIESALGHTIPTGSAASMEDAVFSAHQAAASGDVVLLSPACSSFDMYNSYAERGESFCKAVEKLKLKN